jgi:adenylate cyclase
VYFAPSKNISTVSAADVISGAVPPEFFEGKLALVGTSAAGLLDLRSTPTEKNVPGVTIIAQFIQQIFANEFLQRPDWLFGAEFLAGLVLAVLITLRHSGFRTHRRIKHIPCRVRWYRGVKLLFF